MSEVLENLKDKGVEKISVYMPAISNDRLCLELGSNLLDLKLESGDLKIRGRDENQIQTIGLSRKMLESNFRGV